MPGSGKGEHAYERGGQQYSGEYQVDAGLDPLEGQPAPARRLLVGGAARTGHAHDVSPRDPEAIVTGKGDKQRTIRFTYDTARAFDRYQRERTKDKMARVSALRLGVHGGPMTASGVYQVIERQPEQRAYMLRLTRQSAAACRAR